MDSSSHKRAKLLQSALNALKNSAQFCKRMDDEAMVESNLELLQDTALMYCQMDAEFIQFNKNMDSTENFFRDNEHVRDVTVAEKFDEFSRNDLTPDNSLLSNHSIMIDFLKSIEEVEFEKNDEIDEEFTPPTDPVSKNPIKNPVKNPQCGHIYDNDSITELIALRKNTRCPYIGCPALQYIKLNQLVVDTELKRKIIRYNFNH